jgi:glyoxylase-like metal-dependent hydrolase (beta-lactamase superfamily II)
MIGMFGVTLIRPWHLLAVAAVFCVPATIASPASASAPMAKIAAPGFYRFMLGDFEVTALSDGTDSVDVTTVLRNVSAEKIRQGLDKWHVTGPVMFSYNAFLINTGSKLVLVDTGSGESGAPALGRMVGNLKASGYQPAQVDEVYITHMHGDHIGGLTAAGHAVFANAIVRADRKEGDYWLTRAHAAKAPPDFKDAFKAAIDTLAPYVAAGRYKPFDGGVTLAPGITAVPSHGHTPGHCSYLVESKGHRLLLIGDLIHVQAVQFDNPTATLVWDSDGKMAAAERIKDFKAAASQGILLGAAHVSFPGLGYVAPNGAGFEWLPLRYQQLQ